MPLTYIFSQFTLFFSSMKFPFLMFEFPVILFFCLRELHPGTAPRCGYSSRAPLARCFLHLALEPRAGWLAGSWLSSALRRHLFQQETGGRGREQPGHSLQFPPARRSVSSAAASLQDQRVPMPSLQLFSGSSLPLQALFAALGLPCP